MAKQLYYEDVDEGGDIPPLVKHPTPRQLVMWAGASGDYHEIHYNKEFALSRGLPDIIVHGQLACCFLGQLITDWIGEEGVLKKLSCSYRGMNFPGEDLICQGKVTGKYVEDGGHYIECNIWAGNPQGEKTVLGTAVVMLPARGQGQ